MIRIALLCVLLLAPSIVVAQPELVGFCEKTTNSFNCRLLVEPGGPFAMRDMVLSGSDRSPVCRGERSRRRRDIERKFRHGRVAMGGGAGKNFRAIPLEAWVPTAPLPRGVQCK